MIKQEGMEVVVSKCKHSISFVCEFTINTKDNLFLLRSSSLSLAIKCPKSWKPGQYLFLLLPACFSVCLASFLPVLFELVEFDFL